jgi:retron-type reverse transcriptase
VLYSNRNNGRLNLNGNYDDTNRNGYASQMILFLRHFYIMKTYKHLYNHIYDYKNLRLAYEEAKKGKTKNNYVIEFKKDLWGNLYSLHKELENQTYKPKPLQRFIIKDPKSRVIHASAFPDRIVHHVLIIAVESIFDKEFIYDSCANRIGKGTLFAIKRLDYFKRKVTKNFTKNAYCLKADIKHYFEEVNHEILINILKRKIKDDKVIWLIEKILKNVSLGGEQDLQKGMPLGNLTSQFFANLYLNDFDQFVKHILKAEFYIRYVDDFVILHENEEQLKVWKEKIEKFLREKLKIELHAQKSRIILLSRGIDFGGFRNFIHYRLLRKRNLRKIVLKIKQYNEEKLTYEKLIESFRGWQAYAKWANSYNLQKETWMLAKINPRN